MLGLSWEDLKQGCLWFVYQAFTIHATIFISLWCKNAVLVPRILRMMFGLEFTFLKKKEKRVLIKSLLTYSKECKKSCFFHLTVLIEMTDMWYTEWHFLRCVFEVFFFMVIHAVRGADRQALGRFYGFKKRS